MSQFDVIDPSTIHIHFPADLPISQKRFEIAQALMANQVVIVCGETGSGKTTQLPKIALSIGRGKAVGGKGMIAHTQPRRLAATSTAKRIAQELQSPLGKHVGYKIRFSDKTSEQISIKLMTDGVLLAETQSDPLLNAYDTIIIDEAHERSLNIDFILGYLKQLLPKRPDLKVLITSATIDAQKLAKHFSDNTPVIEVSGRLFPVEMRYRALEESPAASSTDLAQAKQRDWMDAVVEGVDELSRLGSGDLLIFLPGEREIHQLTQQLAKHMPTSTQILPLFARLSIQAQDKVFKMGQARRIILATNVAETSLTVPGIRFVIDVGLARVKRYAYRQKIEQLQIEPISQASANQRAGRCGRVMDGICLRLYSEADFQARQAFTDPEILRSSLTAVILRMKALGLSDIRNFPFVDPPSSRAIADGFSSLKELGALDEQGELLPLGRQLAKLPVDPKIARMIVSARQYDCLTEVLIIASALSIQDPRERPLTAQAQADEAHRQFADSRSEFLFWLNLWHWFADALQSGSTQRELRQLCQQHFIAYQQMREWRDVHQQLARLVQTWRMNQSAATYEQIHCALLSGLLGNIGLKMVEGVQYLGARGMKFHLWPGSPLLKKAGKWVLAAELIETRRLYARGLAKIEPEWVEKVAAHLLKTQISDPHWEKKAGRVIAYQQATLFGLPIYQRRKVSYAPLNGQHAREIFIRAALVEQDWQTNLPFVQKNRQLLADIAQLEHRARRPDILVDDALIFAFYDQHLPASVYDGQRCEAWFREQTRRGESGRAALDALYLQRDDLMRHQAQGVTTAHYPDHLLIAGIEMALTYHFDPTSAQDGVTLQIPLFALNQVLATQMEWLVPGLLKNKVQALLKSLPKSLRRHCMPIEAYTQACLPRLQLDYEQGKGLLDALIADLQVHAKIKVQRDQFQRESLAPYLLMNFSVIDEHQRVLATGRHLSTLQQTFAEKTQSHFQQMTQSDQPDVIDNDLPLNQPLTAWTFGHWQTQVSVRYGQQMVMAFPALVDEQTHCTMRLFDSQSEAKDVHQQGLMRLFALQMRETMRFHRKKLPHLSESSLYFMPWGTQEALFSQIMQIALMQAFVVFPLPTDEKSFAERCQIGKNRFNLLTQEIARLVWQILSQHAQIQAKRAQVKAYAWVDQDITDQLQALLAPNFLIETAWEDLQHFPRYLQGLLMRMEKLLLHPQRDQQLTHELQPLWREYQRAKAQLKGKVDPELVRFRWLLEELRIALFAQSLKTPLPVSVKRLQKIWETRFR